MLIEKKKKKESIYCLVISIIFGIGGSWAAFVQTCLYDL